jgi:hypothetical protein
MLCRVSYEMVGNNHRYKSGLLKPFSLSPNFYAFLGGVLISTAVNLYTGIFASDGMPIRWRVVLLSAILAAVSGAMWSVIAWNLETINRLSIIQSPEFMDEQKIWTKLISDRLPRLIAYFGLGLVSAIGSFGILLV